MAAGNETNTGQDTAEQVRAKTEQFKENVEERLGQQKGVVSRQIKGVAQALRTTADQCERQPDGQPIAGYARRAADGVERIGQVLEGKTLGDMLGDLERVSHERPLLIGAAALVAGFLGARATRTVVSAARTEPEPEQRQSFDILHAEGGI
jgi:hypothetical protein